MEDIFENQMLYPQEVTSKLGIKRTGTINELCHNWYAVLRLYGGDKLFNEAQRAIEVKSRRGAFIRLRSSMQIIIRGCVDYKNKFGENALSYQLSQRLAKNTEARLVKK